MVNFGFCSHTQKKKGCEDNKRKMSSGGAVCEHAVSKGPKTPFQNSTAFPHLDSVDMV